jgi:integrase
LCSGRFRGLLEIASKRFRGASEAAQAFLNGDPMPKITKRLVDTIRPDPAGLERFVWDEGQGALKGFGIRIQPTGSASSYFVQYRNAEGRTRRLALGRIEVLTPNEARSLAIEKLQEVAKGNDPSADRHSTRKGMTISELCDWYLKDAEGRIKRSTLTMDKSRIGRHVKPLLGLRKAAGLTFSEIEKFQAEIASGKTAGPRPKTGRGGCATGGQAVAARTIGMLSTILEFARRHGVIERNVARGVRRFKDQKRTRFLSATEIDTLGRAMRELEREGDSETGVAAIRALLLTGCRRNEILGLKWEWLDLDAHCVRYPDTKSGAQVRPLGLEAVKMIVARRFEPNVTWVFPAARGNGHFVGLPRVLDRVCGRAQLLDVTLHTLRHTFASVAAELGFSTLTIAGMLGHTVPGVTARYGHIPDSALVAAADRVSARIAAVLDGKSGADVVRLRSAQ